MHLEVQDYGSDWDKYFMDIAVLGASRSKDPRTKVGACIVNDKKVLSIGYNGAPRNFPDDLVPDCTDLSKPLVEQKYAYICHAEPNAILNYGGSIKDFNGAKIYCTLFPCHECAKLIIQSGIKEVIYNDLYHRDDCTMNVSKMLFNLSGVSYRKLEVSE